MKGKRGIAGILLVGILAVTLTGCKNTDSSKKETEKPVIRSAAITIHHTII